MDADLEARLARVQRRRLHAVVEREPGNVDGVDTPFAQEGLQCRVLEPGVTLARSGLTFIDDHVDASVESLVELGAWRVAHAVHRPGSPLLGERAVVGRMPVARGDDQRRVRGQPVHGVDDLVTARDREGAAGAEVVLDIDDDQRLHRAKYRPGMGSIRDDLRGVLLPAEEALSLEVGGATNAAVLVPLYLENGELHAVLTRRHSDLRRHAGEISFPGGRAEPGEHDLRTTALRETEEEIGLPPAAVELLGALQPTPTVVTGYAIYPFVGMIEPGHTWTASAGEVAEVIELPLRALLAGYERQRLIRRGVAFRTDTYVVGHYLVWGATARILGDLFDRIEPLLQRWPAS